MTSFEPAVVPFPPPTPAPDTPTASPWATPGKLVGLQSVPSEPTGLATVLVSETALARLTSHLLGPVLLTDPVLAGEDSPLAAAVRAYLDAVDARYPGATGSLEETLALDRLRALGSGVTWQQVLASEVATYEQALASVTAENQRLAALLAAATDAAADRAAATQAAVLTAVVDATPAPADQPEPEAQSEPEPTPEPAPEPAPALDLDPVTGTVVAAPDQTELPSTDLAAEPATERSGRPHWLVERADSPPSGAQFLRLHTLPEATTAAAVEWTQDVFQATQFGSFEAAAAVVEACQLDAVRYRTHQFGLAGLWQEHALAPADPAPEAPASPFLRGA